MCGAMALGELTHHMESRVENALGLKQLPPTLFDELEVSFDRMGFLYDRLVNPEGAAARPAPEAFEPRPLDRPAEADAPRAIVTLIVPPNTGSAGEGAAPAATSGAPARPVAPSTPTPEPQAGPAVPAPSPEQELAAASRAAARERRHDRPLRERRGRALDRALAHRGRDGARSSARWST